MKVRKQFDLENVQFAQDSDEQDKLICNQLIEMYNKQYSLMLSQTKNFFADCKDFLTRFMTINNMGIGFNLPFMLNAFLKIQSETVSPTRKTKQGISWEQKKQKFEKDFTKILNKMGEVIQQLLNFQIKIKTAYLGQAFCSPNKIKTRLTTPKIKVRNNVDNFFNSHPQKNNQNPQQQQILRSILQKGMIPTNKNKVPVCNIKCTPTQNIDKLSNKIDNLKLQIQLSKQKQQKIWKIFNQKRPSQNLLEDSTPQDEQDEEYKKLNNMLSDIISQKNKTFYKSPFETGQSSFR